MRKECWRRASPVSATVLPLLVACWLSACGLSGCGVDPHGSSDAARISTVQEIRKDLKADPRDRDIRYLNVTRGAKLVLDPDRPLDDPARQGMTAEEVKEYEARKQRIVEAREKAQEGALTLYGGDEEAGLALLRESMALQPTLDALVPLVDYYRSNEDEAGIVEACTETRPMIPDRERYELLRHCQLGNEDDPVEDRLSWTSPGDQDWFVVERARLLKQREQGE